MNSRRETAYYSGTATFSTHTARKLKRRLLGICGKSAVKELDEIVDAFLALGIVSRRGARERAIFLADEIVDNKADIPYADANPIDAKGNTYGAVYSCLSLHKLIPVRDEKQKYAVTTSIVNNPKVLH